MNNLPFEYLSRKMLRDLGVLSPTAEQISKMSLLLSNVLVQTPLNITEKLTPQEKTCLLMAAFGNTSQQTAELLNICKDTVESHRKEIRRKLGCNSMAHAVYQGIRYGYLKTV